MLPVAVAVACRPARIRPGSLPMAPIGLGADSGGPEVKEEGVVWQCKLAAAIFGEPVENIDSAVALVVDDILVDFATTPGTYRQKYWQDSAWTPERMVQLLKTRYRDGMTLAELGYIYSVTRERVRQIEAKVLRRLRHPARSAGLKPYVKRE